MARLTSWYREANKMIQNFLHEVVRVMYSIARGIAMVVTLALAIIAAIYVLKWAYGELNRYLLERKRRPYKEWSEDLERQRTSDGQRLRRTQFVIPKQREREYQGRTSESDQREERRPLLDPLYVPFRLEAPPLVDLQPYIQRAQSESMPDSRIGRCWTTILEGLSITIPTSIILKPYYVSISDLEECYRDPDPKAVLVLLLLKSRQLGLLSHVADVYLKSLLYPTVVCFV